jgi:hypothetical protein
MAAAPSSTPQISMASGNSTKNSQATNVQQQFVPPNGGNTPLPLPPQPTPQNIGGAQSLTPGQIIFTEYQARVFNQTEAMYKTSGFLGISLFEDSYLLSKATANYIVSNIGLSAPVAQINSDATQTYRGVLGIANPTPPPPVPIPVGVEIPTPDPVAPAVTPTVFTPPTVTPTVTVAPVLTTNPSLPTSVSNAVNTGTTATSQIAGSLPSVPSYGGSKIICNELYRQGFLTEEMWDADERYGEMMFEKDPKLVIGYQMWARSVVKYMKKNPKNTKRAAWLFKPWTEYMGYKMGVVKKPTLRGRFTNWIGSQFSYAVFNLFNGKRLLDKYNYKLFKSENKIPTYKMA